MHGIPQQCHGQNLWSGTYNEHPVCAGVNFRKCNYIVYKLVTMMDEILLVL